MIPAAAEPHTTPGLPLRRLATGRPLALHVAVNEVLTLFLRHVSGMAPRRKDAAAAQRSDPPSTKAAALVWHRVVHCLDRGEAHGASIRPACHAGAH